MGAYNKNLKLKYVRLVKKGKNSITELAEKAKIPKQTLARWVKLHKMFGPKALENKSRGIKQKPINEGVEKLVLANYKKGKKSVYAMRKELKKVRKNNISERQLRRIYRKNKLE